MDDLISLSSRYLGLSPLNVFLSACIFFLVKERYEGFREDWTIVEAKVTRLERSILSSGIPLLELED